MTAIEVQFMPTRCLSISLMTVAAVITLSHSSIARELTKSEKESISSVVQESLKDPAAAKFTWSNLVNEEFYCGIVNGKNSYGGFVGDAPFIVGLSKGSNGKVTPTSLDIGSPLDSSGTTAEIMNVCRELGYALNLDGNLPSALAKRSTQRGNTETRTEKMTAEAYHKYQQHLIGRLDQSEGVCKLTTGEYLALPRTVCESRKGKVLGY